VQDGFRRQAYLVIAVVGLLGSIGHVLAGDGTAWELRVTYPVLALFLTGALYVLLVRPGSIRLIELVGWPLVATVWLTSMAAGLYSAPDGDQAWESLFPGVFANLVVLIVLAYLWFDTRWALPASLLVPLAATVIGLVRFLPVEAGEPRHVADLLGAQAHVVVLAVLVHLLARHKEALVATTAEADELRTLAYADALTGLPNRRSLTEQLELVVHGPRDERPVSVVAFDLDGFKQVNDEHGHDVGDVVLREVAQVARRSLRPEAVVGRWGGEEFLVLAPRVDAEVALAMAERLRRDIAAHPFPGGLHLTASFGVSEVRDGDPVDLVLHRVDQLLYAAKAAGRDVVVSSAPRPSSDDEPRGDLDPVT